jgi:hypothetical protein
MERMIEPRDQIKISLLCGRVALAALEMQTVQNYNLLRLHFLSLIEHLQNLEKEFPWKDKL